jgi:hypothetical protein
MTRSEWRRVLQAHHPDHGGTAAAFQRVLREYRAWQKANRLCRFETCHKPIPPTFPSERYCCWHHARLASAEARRKPRQLKSLRRAARITPDRHCRECGAVITGRRSKYCGPLHARRAKNAQRQRQRQKAVA